MDYLLYVDASCFGLYAFIFATAVNTQHKFAKYENQKVSALISA